MASRETPPSGEIDRSPSAENDLGNGGGRGFPLQAGGRAQRSKAFTSASHGAAAVLQAPRASGLDPRCGPARRRLPRQASLRPAPRCSLWAAAHLVKGRACRVAHWIGKATRWWHSGRSGSPLHGHRVLLVGEQRLLRLPLLLLRLQGSRWMSKPVKSFCISRLQGLFSL
jgi:hypothetical protein